MSRRLFAVLYLGLGLVGLVGLGLWFAQAHRTGIATDNAEVWAPTYQVQAPSAGRLAAWTSLLPGSRVKAGEILGRLETSGGLRTLRVPHAGRLLGDYGYVGRLVSAAQQLALIGDTGSSYVLAYVDESQAGSLAVGERADLRLATDPSATLHGSVVRIFPAVLSVTWPLPSLQGGGAGRAAQWVPVRIRFAGRGASYLGSSVSVWIRIGGGSGD